MSHGSGSDEAREIGHAGDLTVVPGLIHGLRRWQLNREGSAWRLAALGQPVIWPVDEPLAAECLGVRMYVEQLEPHDPPGIDCRCGIYALHPFGEMAKALAEEAVDGDSDSIPGACVYGVVSAWGRIEVHQDGFRAERAWPAALILSESSTGTEYERAVREVAAQYGIQVEVIESADALGEICFERWPGLPDPLVQELLVGEREVVLVKRMASIILRDGTSVAGAGFVVDGEDYEPWFWDARWELGEEMVRVVRVAGARYARDAIQSEAFAPAARVRLVAEPDNPHDPNAVAIYDAAGELKAGYVPRRLASAVARELARGRLGEPIVVWQWRDMRTGERVGLCVLIPRLGLDVCLVDEAEDGVVTITTDGPE